MKYTPQQAAELIGKGESVLHFDNANINNLHYFIKLAFPNDVVKPNGTGGYYGRSSKDNSQWIDGDQLKDFASIIRISDIDFGLPIPTLSSLTTQSIAMEESIKSMINDFHKKNPGFELAIKIELEYAREPNGRNPELSRVNCSVSVVV